MSGSLLCTGLRPRLARDGHKDKKRGQRISELETGIGKGHKSTQDREILKRYKAYPWFLFPFHKQPLNFMQRRHCGDRAPFGHAKRGSGISKPGNLPKAP